MEVGTVDVDVEIHLEHGCKFAKKDSLIASSAHLLDEWNGSFLIIIQLSPIGFISLLYHFVL
jgi:hypothetical protein